MQSSAETATTGEDATPEKQQIAKRNSLFGDELMNFDPDELEDSDWGEVFDDQTSSKSSSKVSAPQQTSADPQGPDSLEASLSPTQNDASLTLKQESASGHATNEPLAPNAETVEPGPSTAGMSEGQTKSSENDWKDLATDKVHREKMIQDITQLLYERKKDQKRDDKSINRLNAQARAFEAQLYKNASSLEAYKDRSNLKRRIGKLAQAFASYFKQAKKRSSATSTVSMTSLGSLDGKLNGFNLRQSTSLGGTSEPNAGKTSSSLPQQLLNSISSVQNPAVATPGNLPAANMQRMISAPLGTNGNTMGSIAQQNQMAGMTNQLGMNLRQQQQSSSNNSQQLQQQLLMRLQQQQQQLLARQMNMNVGNQQGSAGNQAMTVQAAMMGNNNVPMMNQLQQQGQATNELNMNMLQQRNILRQQQQQQQPQNAMNLNLMQQQNTNSTMMMSGSNGGMNLMNMQMQNALSGAGNMAGGNMPNMSMANATMAGSLNNRRLSASGMLNLAGTPQRQPGGHEDSSPLSPGSFHW